MIHLYVFSVADVSGSCVFFSGTKRVIQASLNFPKKSETKELQVDS